MSRSTGTPGSTATDRGTLQPDWRLLAIVLVCVVALLGLAAIGPSLGPGSGPSEQNQSDGQQRDTSGQQQQGGSGGGPQGGGEQPGGSQTGSDGGGGQGSAGQAGPSGALGEGGDLRGSVRIGSLVPGGTVRGGATTGGTGGSGGVGADGAVVGDLRDAGELVLVAEADGPAYWRLGSFSHFEDGQWHRLPADAEYTPRRDDEAEFAQRIRLHAEHRTLPAAWRPVSGDSPTAIDVTAERTALRADDPIPAGHSYTARSARPSTDPAVLRDAASNGSTSFLVDAAYASRLGDTTERVGRFTTELTEGDETRYDRARTIEQWLRTEKRYDRNASASGNGPVVDQIVFEMDAVGSEHAATAMVGMLRSQGIPARYVTGYSTGYEVDGRYFVTEQQSHAWVEVYFPGEGWVPFDPTSPAERRPVEGAVLLAEGSGLREDLGNHSLATNASRAELVEDVEGAIAGSVVANGTGGATPIWVERSEDGDAVDVSEDAPEGYAIQLNQSEPLPGSNLAIRVLEDGEPAQDVRVSLDGEYVGTTGPQGTVTTRVPWVEEIRIAIEPPPSGTRARIDGSAVGEADGSVRTGASSTSGGITDSADDEGPPAVGLAGTGSVASAGVRGTSQDAPGNESGGVAVPTYSDVRIRLAGPPAEGAEVRITATLAGRPVPDAAVAVDGEFRTRTTDDGTATVTLPDESGNATIRVRRGEVVDERTVRVRPIDVEAVEGLAAPGANATLSLSVGNQSLGGYDVALDGDSIGRTDAAGWIDVRLPDESGEVPIAVRADGFAATTSVEVAPLTIAVEERLPLPGRPVTVAVEHRGEPVDGATVAVDGQRVGTATNGTITVDLPVDDDVQLTARYAGVEAETEVGDLYRNAVLLGVLALLGLVGLLYLGVRLYRRYADPLRDEATDRAGTLRDRIRIALRRLADRCRRVPPRLVDLAVRAGRLLHRAAERLGAALHDLARRVADAARTAADRGVWILLAVPRVLRGFLVRVLRALDPRRLYARLRTLIARWRSSPASSSSGADARASGSVPSAAPDAEGDVEQPVIDLRDAWRAFVRAVRPPRVETKTAGEIGRYAVDRGMPATPVDTVVETYRAAEYGGTTPSTGRLRRVVEAVREIAGEDVLAGRLPGDRDDRGGSGDADDAGGGSTGRDGTAGDPAGAGGD